MFVEVLQRSNKQDLSCARNDLTAISVCLENMGEQWAIKLAMKGEKMHEICWLASKATVNNYRESGINDIHLRWNTMVSRRGGISARFSRDDP